MNYWVRRLRISRPKLRFNLRFLLVLMLVSACALSAYFTGRRAGYEQGYIAGRWSIESKIRSTKIYNVADLIGAMNPQQPRQDFDTLIDLITATVTPEAWESNGGDSAVEAFPTNFSLVVSHSNEGHAAIAKLLDELRTNIRLANTVSGKDRTRRSQLD